MRPDSTPPADRRWGLVVVHGRSLQPTLVEGDRLLGRHGARPRPGRLVVVRLPARAGAAGGRPGTPRVLAVKRATRHGPDGWWVERDNPREGVDSWQVGAVPDDDVLAVVLLRLWPPRRRRRRL